MKIDSEYPILYYVHDPMCSWCWGFRPVWERVQESLADEVHVVKVLGGLAPDSDVPMQEEMRRFLQQTWKKIETQIPGTVFNYDFWTKNTPRRSTWPACRAVLSAGFQDAGAADQMSLAIQQAYYTKAMNPSDDDVLTSLALELGLDVQRFTRDLNSVETRDALQQDFALRDQLSVQGFPSLVLSYQQKPWPLALDYRDARPILNAIRSITG